MAIFTLNIERELNDQLTVKQDGGSLIWGNAEANQVVVVIMDNGAAVALSGTVEAQMLRADGQTLVWTGNIIDGAAVVTLPASAYAVQGPAELNVDLVDGSQRMTLVVLRMMVDATTSNAEVAPVDTVPNLATLLAKIAEMEAATQAANEAAAAVPAMIATTFSTSTAYVAGQTVYYNGALYRFTANHAAGAWTGADVVQIVLGDEVGGVKSDVNDLKSALKETNNDISDVAVMASTISKSGVSVPYPDRAVITDVIVKGATTSAFDGMTVIDGVNIKCTNTNGQTDTHNKFIIGSGQIAKANGTDNFVASCLPTYPTVVSGEYITGRSNSSALEICLDNTKCAYTKDAANAYLSAHPIRIWFTSTTASPTEFYQYVKCIGSTQYFALGTMTAKSQLSAGDWVDFSTGEIVLDNVRSTVQISGGIKNIPADAIIASTGTVEARFMTSLEDEFKATVNVNGWNQINPANTTFFDTANFFVPDQTVVKTNVYANESGVITSASSTVLSMIIKIKPSTNYVLRVPGNNRAIIVESTNDLFTVGQTYTLDYTSANTDTDMPFTTGQNAGYIFAYVYNGSYDYNTNKWSILLIEGTAIPEYTTPVVKKQNLPQDMVADANPFYQKSLLIFGDSITDTCDFTINGSDETTEVEWKNPSNSYTPSGGTTIYYSMWPKILRDSQGFAEIRNYARQGASYKTSERTSGEERQNLQYQITVALNDKNNPNDVFEIDNFVPDIVIFALGTNDGTPNDTFESAMSKTVLEEDGCTIDVEATLAALDDTKFCESARKAFLRIKQAFPMAQIYCALPIQRANNDTNWGTLREYLSQMAQRYGCVIIDSTAESGITREFNVWNEVGEYLKDGLHPNDKGQNLLARTILTSLKMHYVPFGNGFNPMS